MQKRSAVLFAVFMICVFSSLLSVRRVSEGQELAAAAQSQQTCTISVASLRGTIYDRNLDPLTGTGKTEYPSAVRPEARAASALQKALSPADWTSARKLLSEGKPFAMKLPSAVSAEGILSFPVRERYADSSAAHIVGYLDSSGNGASGMEKAYDSILTGTGAGITVSYRTDALGRALPDREPAAADASALAKSGVVLTLDASIQKLAERAAAKYIRKGAVVILSVPSAEILAAASLPGFSRNDLSAALRSADSPLLDRAFSAYCAGSVFKVAAAAAALESGISPAERYRCVGYEEAGGMYFHCFDSEAHGTEDMKSAVANSCNAYFVNLMKKVPADRFLQMAKDLGFGKSETLAPGMETSAGTLPSLQSLSSPRALANFSFGQGELTATPLQIAGMMNAVASGGIYTAPSLALGFADESKKISERFSVPGGKRVMTEKTASLLREFMAASVDSGTGKKGKPDYGTASAKTGTAQTGRYQNGTEEVESWYAGIYPRNTPRFVIVVFAEGGSGGGTSCGPVFREIADGLYGYVS